MILEKYRGSGFARRSGHGEFPCLSGLAPTPQSISMPVVVPLVSFSSIQVSHGSGRRKLAAADQFVGGWTGTHAVVHGGWESSFRIGEGWRSWRRRERPEDRICAWWTRTRDRIPLAQMMRQWPSPVQAEQTKVRLMLLPIFWNQAPHAPSHFLKSSASCSL
jgi:hypothetical protein